MPSVLQDWVTALPIRYQGTILTAIRGCDDEPKAWMPDGQPLDSQARRLTAYIRFCTLNPADEREVDMPGAFFQTLPPQPFKPSALGHLPLHWYSHAMHTLEIIGYHHPSFLTRTLASGLYFDMVHGLHLMPESKDRLHERLTEDRLVNGTVVS